MSAKEVKFSVDARDRMLHGIDTLAHAFDRAAAAIVGQLAHQIDALAVAANVKHEAFAVAEADLAHHCLDA